VFSVLHLGHSTPIVPLYYSEKEYQFILKESNIVVNALSPPFTPLLFYDTEGITPLTRGLNMPGFKAYKESVPISS